MVEHAKVSGPDTPTLDPSVAHPHDMGRSKKPRKKVKDALPETAKRGRVISGPISSVKWSGDLNKDLKTFVGMHDFASLMTDEARQAYGSQIVEMYELDDDSRYKWKVAAERGLALVEELDEETEPKANVTDLKKVPSPKHPLLVQAIMEFAARAYPALLGEPVLVKALPAAKEDEGDDQATENMDKVAFALSTQVRVHEPHWESDTDRILHHQAVTGMAFRKRYYDPVKRQMCSEFVSSFDVIVNNRTASLEAAPRITHRLYEYPHNLRALMNEGYYHRIELGRDRDTRDPDAEVELIEQQCWLAIFGKDDIEVPCTVTVHVKTKQIVRFVAGFAASGFTVSGEKGNEFVHFNRMQFFTDYHFIPDFRGYFYSYGYGKLLGQLNETINSVLDSIVKTADNYTKNGGIVGTAGRMPLEEVELKPDRITSVPIDVGNLKEQLMLLPTKPPSQVLFAVLGLLTEAGQRLSSTVDLTQSASTMAATTTAAIVEQGQRLYSSIYKRTYEAMTREFKLLYRLNKEFLRGEIAYSIDGNEGVVNIDIMSADVRIILTADPNITSDIQRQTLIQVYMQFLGGPNINNEELLRRIFTLLKVPDVKSVIVPTPQEPPLEAQIEMRKIELSAMEAQRKMFETQARVRLMAAQAMAEVQTAMSAAAERDNKQVSLALERARLALDAFTTLSDPMKGTTNGDGSTGPANAGQSGGNSIPPDAQAQLGGIDDTLGAGELGFGPGTGPSNGVP